MAGKERANGEGTVCQRADGRCEGAGYVLTTDGTSERVRVYGATRKQAADKLTEKLADSQHDRPTPVNSNTTVGEYLLHWLTTVAVHRVRPSTYTNYDTYVRGFLIPDSATDPCTPSPSPRSARSSTAPPPCASAAPAAGTPAAIPAPAQGSPARLLRDRQVLPAPVQPATIRYIRAVLSAALAHAVRDGSAAPPSNCIIISYADVSDRWLHGAYCERLAILIRPRFTHRKQRELLTMR
jgi:hypothetical protein